MASLPRFLRHWREFQAQREADRAISADFPFGKLYPCLTDHLDTSGEARGHYFHQDLLVARRIFEASPDQHLDVGSRLDGFVAHVAAFRPIQVLDIRPLTCDVTNLSIRQVDLMGMLPPDLVGCTDSLSCLHTLEHFGLGRYGDAIDPNGHLTGLSNLCRILRPGGRLYCSVPIGPQRIEFNAHRVFSVEYILRMVQPSFAVTRFSFVDDAGDLHEDVDLAADAVANNFQCEFGCGIFELRKKQGRDVSSDSALRRRVQHNDASS